MNRHRLASLIGSVQLTSDDRNLVFDVTGKILTEVDEGLERTRRTDVSPPSTLQPSMLTKFFAILDNLHLDHSKDFLK